MITDLPPWSYYKIVTEHKLSLISVPIRQCRIGRKEHCSTQQHFTQLGEAQFSAAFNIGFVQISRFKSLEIIGEYSDNIKFYK